MLRRSLAGVVDPAAFEATGIDPDLAGREPRCVGMGQTGGVAGADHRPSSAGESALTFEGDPKSRHHGVSVTESAPAKLTLSLRVTGRPRRRAARARAEMVTIDLADALDLLRGIGPDGDRRGSRRSRTRRALTDDNLVDRALALVGRHAAVRLDQAHTGRRGSRRGIGRCCSCTSVGRCDEPDTLRLSSARMCRSAWLAGGPASRGSESCVTPLAVRGPRFVLLLPPISVDTGAVYRAWDYLHRKDWFVLRHRGFRE